MSTQVKGGLPVYIGRVPLLYAVGAGGLQTLINEYSMQFDGVDDYIDTGGTSTVTDTSISFWVKGPLSGSLGYIVGSDYVGLYSKFGKTAPANPDIYMHHPTPGWVSIVSDVFDDTWHHIVVTLDSTIGEIKSYKDGVPNTTVTVAALIGLPANITTIGSYTGGGSQWLEGMLDEVAVFDYVLTEPQALDIYSATDTGKTADLSTLATPPLVWYRMGD